MELLQVNLFCSKPERFSFAKRSFDEINLCSKYKNIVVCIHTENNTVDAWISSLKQNRPRVKIILVRHNVSNYLEKVYFSHTTGCEYSCKLDDDTLISRHVWDFVVDNLSCHPCSKLGFDACPKGHFKCMLHQNMVDVSNFTEKYL